ncbi:MAG: histidinol-phosphatase HisJ family protein [Deltaproteobacteria bacterium]
MIVTSIDGHVHTALCRHASGTMEQYVESAMAKGLAGIVFLEHLECGINYFERVWLTEEDFVEFRWEAEKLKEKYAGRIEVLCGVEVGYNPKAVDRILSFLDRQQWDRIGLSYHFFEADGRHINMFSRKQQNLDAIQAVGPLRIFEGYYQGLIEAVSRIDGHVVCHLDAALRHVQAEVNFDAADLIGELLAVMAKRRLALELNAAGFAIRGEQFPTTRIVRQAAALKIPLWAGSDAHKPEDVGRYFDRLEGLEA